MNILNHRRITIDYWVWEPLAAKARANEDAILALKQEGKLLPDCGYVQIRFDRVQENAGEQEL